MDTNQKIHTQRVYFGIKPPFFWLCVCGAHQRLLRMIGLTAVPADAGTLLTYNTACALYWNFSLLRVCFLYIVFFVTRVNTLIFSGCHCHCHVSSFMFQHECVSLHVYLLSAGAAATSSSFVVASPTAVSKLASSLASSARVVCSTIFFVSFSASTRPCAATTSC